MILALHFLLHCALLAAGGGESSYRVEDVPIPAGLVPEIAGIAFAQDGALWVASRRGVVWRVDLAANRWDVFAQGLHECTGIRAGETAHDVYVCDRPSLVHVRDLDGDFRADDYESLSEAWGLSGNYHEYSFGPVRAADGSFFVALGCGSELGPTLPIPRGPVNAFGRVGRMFSAVPYRGWVLQITPDGETVPFAKGFREPNGLVSSPGGELFVTDNQGDWLGTSAMYHVQKDRFYGHPSSLVWEPGFTGDPLATPIETLEKMRERAIVLFPHNRCCNSPTQPLFDLTNGAFGPFGGQMILGDIPVARLLRVELELVGGEFQGAVFPLLEGHGLRSGCNRFAFAPDGKSLLVGEGSRGWADGEGLQRVVFTGRVPFEILALHLTRGGFEVEFTKPVAREAALDLERWSLSHYHYLYHRPYGSPEIGERPAPVGAVDVSADGRRVTLSLAELAPLEIYELHVRDLVSLDGEPLEHAVAYYTLNRLQG